MKLSITGHNLCQISTTDSSDSDKNLLRYYTVLDQFVLKSLMQKIAHYSLNWLAGFSFRMDVMIIEDVIHGSYFYRIYSSSRHIS